MVVIFVWGGGKNVSVFTVYAAGLLSGMVYSISWVLVYFGFFLIYLVFRGRMHNNVLVYAETSGYVGTNKSETNRRS